MAEVKLFEFADYKNSVAGQNLAVWVEDSNSTLIVRRFGGGRTRIITANDLDPYDQAPHLNSYAAYTFCRGADLVKFKGIPTFPYAQEELELNASVCQVSDKCDLTVVSVATTPETVTGAGDGTATVTASGTWPGKEYSLDNAAWSSSPTFTGLDPGGYTAYVRDSKGCAASGAFTVGVGAPNSYGLRYYLDYDDMQGKLYGLKIFKKFYSGVPEEAQASGQPMSIRYLFGSDRFAPLVGSELTVELLREVHGQFEEFFTSDEREYRVELWDNETQALIWRGFVLPDVYSEPFVTSQDVVQIVATDGLGTLKEEPFLDSGGRAYTGRRTLLQIIMLCLQKLDVNLPIAESVNWFEAGMDTTGDLSPLVQLDQDVGEFYDQQKGEASDCDTVLAGLLGNFKAQMLQSEGYWVIHQPNAIFRESDSPPPPPEYPALSFNLEGARYDSQAGSGSVRVLNAAGGNPADGQFQLSADGGATWRNLLSLTEYLPGWYIFDGLPGGKSGVMLLRRENKPVVTAERGFSIPSPIIIGVPRLAFTAGYNKTTGVGTVTISRELEGPAGSADYETWRIDPLGLGLDAKIESGTFEFGPGVGLKIFTLTGSYKAAGPYELRIGAVTPSDYLFSTPTRFISSIF